MLLHFVLFLTCTTKVFGQSQANCDNISLSIDTIYLIPDIETVVGGDLLYNDTLMTSYPSLVLKIPDNPYVTTTDVMVLSSLDSGFVQPFAFVMIFVNTDFPNNTVIPIQFHIYDSDWPGDSIVTCYFPITLILKNDNTAFESLNEDATSVYPNPTSGDLFVTCSQDYVGKILTINSMCGKVIYSTSILSEQQAINTSTFPTGLYLVCIDNQIVNKVVIRD